MEAMRQSWSDDRLDDFKVRMEENFRHVDQRFEQVDKRFEQVDQRFEQIDKRFEQVYVEMRTLRGEMNARFEAVQTRTDAQFASLHRLILQVGGGGIATMVLGFVGLVVSHA